MFKFYMLKLAIVLYPLYTLPLKQWYMFMSYILKLCKSDQASLSYAVSALMCSGITTNNRFTTAPQIGILLSTIWEMVGSGRNRDIVSSEIDNIRDRLFESRLRYHTYYAILHDIDDIRPLLGTLHVLGDISDLTFEGLQSKSHPVYTKVNAQLEQVGMRTINIDYLNV